MNCLGVTQEFMQYPCLPILTNFSGFSQIFGKYKWAVNKHLMIILYANVVEKRTHEMSSEGKTETHCETESDIVENTNSSVNSERVNKIQSIQEKNTRHDSSKNGRATFHF